MIESAEIQPDTNALTDYSAWKDSLSLIEYAGLKLTPDTAVAAAKLFWPDFVEHDGCVFHAFRFSLQNYKTWQEKFEGNASEIERMVNHVHLAQDLFSDFEDMAYHNVLFLGQVLLKTWKHALETQFPGQVFEVQGEKDPDFEDFVITFWQVR